MRDIELLEVGTNILLDEHFGYGQGIGLPSRGEWAYHDIPMQILIRLFTVFLRCFSLPKSEHAYKLIKQLVNPNRSEIRRMDLNPLCSACRIAFQCWISLA